MDTPAIYFWSVAYLSTSIDIPDFTRGSWETNQPVKLTLKGGATTEVREDIILSD